MIRFYLIAFSLAFPVFALGQNEGAVETETSAGSFRVRKGTIIDVSMKADSVKPQGWAPFSAADFGYVEGESGAGSTKKVRIADELSAGLYFRESSKVLDDQPQDLLEYIYLADDGKAYHFHSASKPEQVLEQLRTDSKQIEKVSGNWWQKPLDNPEYVVRFRTGEPGNSFSILFEGQFFSGTFEASKENSNDDGKEELQFKIVM